MPDPVTIIVTVLAVVAIAALLIWLVDYARVPHPFGLIARVAIVVLAVLYLLRAFGFV